MQGYDKTVNLKYFSASICTIKYVKPHVYMVSIADYSSVRAVNLHYICNARCFVVSL